MCEVSCQAAQCELFGNSRRALSCFSRAFLGRIFLTPFCDNYQLTSIFAGREPIEIRLHNLNWDPDLWPCQWTVVRNLTRAHPIDVEFSGVCI